MARRRTPTLVNYWGYGLAVLLVYSVGGASLGPGLTLVAMLLLIAYVLLAAPVWCGAVNRQRGKDIEYCRNNSNGLLLGCHIRKHKWEKLTASWWGQGWREQTRGLWAGPAAKFATVSGLIGTVTGIWGVIKG